ncbi:MAG TPA: hypothetical protein VG122_04905 [Gemmata sp.]|nr:hypothetical protein [Gemmata sp.]
MTPSDDTDIGVIDVPEFGFWAEKKELTPVPPGLRAADHPYQWTGLLPAYREQLIEWGGQAQAIPLAGDGYVLVYRADRLKDPKFIAAFNAQFARAPVAPTSWEEFADIAAVFAKLDGRPSLPQFTNSELATLFFRIAACYDRLAQSETINTNLGSGLGTLSFQFDLADGKPRLTAPAFAAAANWLGGLVAKKCLPSPAAGTSSDPSAALARNQAMIAVLSLDQLAQLPRENGAVPDRFGLAALPGTRTAFDPEKRQFVLRPVPNYVPYFAGGRLGVVRTRCSNATAAFDLLAELGGPTRSLEIIASTGVGAGPFRVSHLDRDRLQIWFGYGFDADRSDALRRALQDYIHLDVKNPTYGLRGPDQAALSSAAAIAMGKISAGTSTEPALEQLLVDWQQIDAKNPPETRLKWRKLAAGLE